MIDYNYHNDNAANADKTAIIASLPDILIDNTPGGFYGQANGGVGCLPLVYKPYGIKVYCYLIGGYEGTVHGLDSSELNANLARITAIAADSAEGVFLDEVSNFPNNAGNAYLLTIYNHCQSLGLKLILNPGTYIFDTTLMNKCDFILTDELYNGSRLPSTSESPFLDRVLVVANSVNNPNSAATISLGARTNGFGFSYACEQYVTLPPWLSTYLTLIENQPITIPTIVQNGNMLHSSVQYGNQWYEVSQGIIPGATAQTFIPTVSGNYYSIVTLQGCSSDTSNIIDYFVTGYESIELESKIQLYPNPAVDAISIDKKNESSGTTLYIYNYLGSLVKTSLLEHKHSKVLIQDLPNGVYMVRIITENSIESHNKLIIQK